MRCGVGSVRISYVERSGQRTLILLWKGRLVTPGFTHFDEHGRAQMVDVGHKPATLRRAIASGEVQMSRSTALAIRTDQIAKGDVLGVARLAGIMAAKKTSDLIPLCHLVPLDSVKIDFEWREEVGAEETTTLMIVAQVAAQHRTGVEMEALTAVSVAALTLYDMCKSIDRAMVINRIQLDEKIGGQRGAYQRKDAGT